MKPGVETAVSSSDARPQGQSPVPFAIRHAGRTALCPEMSVAPAAVHNPSGAEFGGWDHYSFDFVMSTSWQNDRAVGEPGDRGCVHLISSLVKISEIDNHQQKPTENQRLSPSSLSVIARVCGLN